MPDGFTIDTSEFDRAIVDLHNLPRAVFHHADQAGQQFARTVRDAWRDKLEGTRSAPLVHTSISYERTSGGTDAFEYEIGANKGTGQQGGVALLLEYGASGPRGAQTLGARGLGLASMSENIDDLYRGIEQAIADGARELGWS